jgi:hypothetical protein
MTDQQLLERAARAVGIPCPLFYEGDDQRGWGAYVKIGKGHYWRPLDDDGDALRLAIVLHMRVDIVSAGVVVYVEARVEDDPVILRIVEQFSAHADAATAVRRAIVKAAASAAAQSST